MTTVRVSNSKQFLINRIVEQAKLEGIHLDDIEVRMLGFAEATASARDLEAAQVFERDFDDKEYEAKIAKLIRNAYEQDQKTGQQETWDKALERLAHRDIYLHVMLERAGLENSGVVAQFTDWRFIVRGVLPAAVFLVTAFLVGFTPVGARLIRNDPLRLLAVILLVGMPFALYRIGSGRHASR